MKHLTNTLTKLMENKMTAVEWLYNLSKKRELDIFDLEQAKQIEKQQIIDSWIATENELQRLAAEKYYNQTFNQKKS